MWLYRIKTRRDVLVQFQRENLKPPALIRVFAFLQPWMQRLSRSLNSFRVASWPPFVVTRNHPLVSNWSIIDISGGQVLSLISFNFPVDEPRVGRNLSRIACDSVTQLHAVCESVSASATTSSLITM